MKCHSTAEILKYITEQPLLSGHPVTVLFHVRTLFLCFISLATYKLKTDSQYLSSRLSSVV